MLVLVMLTAQAIQRFTAAGELPHWSEGNATVRQLRLRLIKLKVMLTASLMMDDGAAFDDETALQSSAW